MKSKFSLVLSAGLMSVAVGVSPVLMTGNAQALSESIVSEGQDIIERTTEPQGCVWIYIPGPGWRCI